MPVGAAKTGMLSRSATVHAVADVLARSRPPFLVVDPVMVASSGDALMQDDAAAAIIERLFPLASLITPNIPEAERLAGVKIDTLEGMRHAATKLQELGAAAVLVKGGHLQGSTIIDLLAVGGTFHEFSDVRLETEHTHGTGCALAAAVTAHLAAGVELTEAVTQARSFVRRGIEQAVVLGRGCSPINYLAEIR